MCPELAEVMRAINNLLSLGKRLQVFYVVEREQIIAVTAYVFYGTWDYQNKHSL